MVWKLQSSLLISMSVEQDNRFKSWGIEALHEVFKTIKKSLFVSTGYQLQIFLNFLWSIFPY